MKIGIIGAGAIGYNLAKKLVANHEVRLAASKMSDELSDKASAIGATAVELREAVKGADMVILSIPFMAIAKLPKDLFEEEPQDLIIVDTSNYYPFRDGNISELDNGEVESLWVSKQLGRPVIKAFNNMLEHTLVHSEERSKTSSKIAISIAGDSDEAKQIVSTIIANEIGFDVVDGGRLIDSWRQQPGTAAYCTELNDKELRNALKTANKEQAPRLRDEVIQSFLNANQPFTHDQVVALNRKVYNQIID